MLASGTLVFGTMVTDKCVPKRFLLLLYLAYAHVEVFKQC